YGEGQTCEIILVIYDQHPFILIGENVLAEPGKKTGQLLVDGRQSLLLILVQAGTLTNKVSVIQPHEALLFSREVARFTRLVHRLDTGEEFFVLIYLIREGRKSRRHLALNVAKLGRT